MKTLNIFSAIALCMGLMLNMQVLASEAEILPTSIDFRTVKQNKDSRLLQARLVAEDTNGRKPVKGIMVEFFLLSSGGREKLGEMTTDDNGSGSILLTGTSGLQKGDDGYLHFVASFAGNDILVPAESEIRLKDAWLELEMFLEDSVRNIRYSGFTFDDGGNVVPIADQDIYLFVPRMFSMMPIADGWLESDGSGVVEFPPDLIGDEHGNIEIIARIEDHPEFGNLEANGKVDWALTKHPERAEGPLRELWTPIAPTWMIVTLITLLSGVWLHYFYAVFELFRIKKAGNPESGN